MFSIAIIAGGLATRLRPITENIPKSLIEFSGKPFIFYQLEYLYKQGIKKVVLCIGHLGKIIQEKVGDGRYFNLDIKYSFDGDFPLGTGGSIKKALPMLDKNFFVLYGDSFLPINFNSVKEFYLQKKKLALMTVIRNNNKWDKSNVVFKNDLILKYNKKKSNLAMKYIDYGLGVLTKSIFDRYRDKQFFDLAEIYSTLSVENNLAGYEVYDRFYEIGSMQGLKDTKNYFSKFYRL